MRSTRHGAAKLRRKDNDLAKQEAKKQLVLSDCVNAESAANASMKPLKTTNKPLIERARKAVSEVLSGEVSLPEVKPATGNLVVPSIEDNGSNANPVGREATQNRVFVEVQPLSYRVSQERELKFTAAGWKRDCHGRWFKDENVSSLDLLSCQYEILVR